jgi:hypothetical protein
MGRCSKVSNGPNENRNIRLPPGLNLAPITAEGVFLVAPIERIKPPACDGRSNLAELANPVLTGRRSNRVVRGARLAALYSHIEDRLDVKTKATCYA